MIEFTNVYTGEKRTVDTEPMIAALFNSGDRHVNATLGQDFGWRLAPETVRRIREIKSDPDLMARIAAAFQMPQDAMGDTDIIRWISLEDARKQVVSTEDRREELERRYRAELDAINNPSPTEQNTKVTQDPVPSQPAGAKTASAKKPASVVENDKIETGTKPTEEK